MTVNQDQLAPKRFGSVKLSGAARFVPPLPLFALQPLLKHILNSVVKRRPELFARLGDNCKKRFLIDPNDLPFFLLLEPDPKSPSLKAFNRGREVEYDVCISATFRTHLKMIDSQTDGDALFFNRDLTITGDTEAIVALRNALDDMDGTLAGDVAASFGMLSGAVRSIFNLAGQQNGAQS